MKTLLANIKCGLILNLCTRRPHNSLVICELAVFPSYSPSILLTVQGIPALEEETLSNSGGWGRGGFQQWIFQYLGIDNVADTSHDYSLELLSVISQKYHLVYGQVH